MTEAFAPRSTGKLESVDLTGMLIPWLREQPCFLDLVMSPDLYLPCFEREGDLGVLTDAGVEYDGIKRIEDHEEFLRSIPHKLDGRRVHVITGLRKTPTGTFKFTQLYRD